VPWYSPAIPAPSRSAFRLWFAGRLPRDYAEGFRGLKMIAYHDYCSLECGVQGKAEEEIPKAFRFLAKQWEAAAA